jgi:hypothetical protein
LIKNNGENKKKKIIFKKKNRSNNNLKLEKRNTKNIAKNFCKAFITYLDNQN